MNNDIAQTLSKYDGQDAKEILGSPSLERDIVIVGKAMESKDEALKEKARNFFLTLLGELDTQIDALKAQMKTNEVSMEQVQRISDACIAYMKPTGSNK